MARYCQACGARMGRKVVEGRERDVCGNCGVVFYENRKLSASMRVDIDGRLLLVQRGIQPWYGAWHMPSGYVEVDEEPERAAEREAWEETGMTVKAGKLVGYYTYSDDPRGNGIILLFEGQEVNGEPVPGEETLAVEFFTPEEIENLTLAGLVAEKMVADWIEKGRANDG